MEILFFLFAASLAPICLNFSLLVLSAILRPFRFRLFVIKESRIIKKIENQTTLSTYSTETSKHSGIMLSRNFVAYLKTEESQQSGSSKSLHLVCSRSFFDEISADKPAPSSLDQESDCQSYQTVETYQFPLVLWNDCYKQTKNFKCFDANSFQKKIISKIVNEYQSDSFSSFSYLISGKPQSGKSILASILAVQLNASYCSTFNPSSPSHDISYLHHIVEPTESNPLVILIDEVDSIIDDIHNSRLSQHYKQFGRLCYNKPSWNSFLDSIDRNDYPHTIFIFTSNKKKEYFDGLDPSYFRKGRIDEYFSD
jgi:hypothetical protein